MIHFLVQEGYGLSDVLGMTLRQLLLFTEIASEAARKRAPKLPFR